MVRSVGQFSAWSLVGGVRGVRGVRRVLGVRGWRGPSARVACAEVLRRHQRHEQQRRGGPDPRRSRTQELRLHPAVRRAERPRVRRFVARYLHTA